MCMSQSNDIQTLHSILIDRFSNRPGYDLVSRVANNQSKLMRLTD